MRFVVDLDRINQAVLEKTSVKYSDLSYVPPLLSKGLVWMWSIDIQKAYYHIPLSAALSKLCCIRHQGVVYSFQALPLGLNVSPRVWTLILGFLLKTIKGDLSGCVLPYVDDLLGMAATKEQAQADILKVVNLLVDAGFRINWEKSILTPTQRIVHLGLIIDSVEMRFIIPQNKIVDICNLCYTAATKASIRRKTAHSLLGKLIALTRAFAPVKAYSWNLISEITKARLDPRLVLSESARSDLLWIHRNLPLNPSRSLVVATTLDIFTDASLSGWGAWIPSLQTKIWGRWSRSLRANPPHIQILEMQAIRNAIRFSNLPVGSKVRIRTDNMSALAYCRKWGGSKNQSMKELAFHLWEDCLLQRVSIEAVRYINTKLNIVADSLSRM